MNSAILMKYMIMKLLVYFFRMAQWLTGLDLLCAFFPWLDVNSFNRIGADRWKAGEGGGGRLSDLVRPPLRNDVCRSDMIGVEKQNTAQPSGVQQLLWVVLVSSQ